MFKKFLENFTPAGSRASPKTPNSSNSSLDSLVSSSPPSSTSSKKSPSASWNLFSKTKTPSSTPSKTLSNNNFASPSVKELNNKFLEAMKEIEELEDTKTISSPKIQITPSKQNTISARTITNTSEDTISLDFYVKRALERPSPLAASPQIDKTATIYKNVTLIGNIVIKPFTVIYPNVIIENLGEGSIEIGEHNIICSNVQIRNHSHDTMTIGNGNQFCIGSIIEALHIGNGNHIGCRSHLEPSVHIQDRCIIGEYCTLKQVHLVDESMVPNELLFVAQR